MNLDCKVQKYYGIYLILLRKNGTLILTRETGGAAHGYLFESRKC